MDKLKDIEAKAIYRALISNDYPSRISKSFVKKVMNEIKLAGKYSDTFGKSLNTFGKSLIRYASVFTFAVLTLYILNYNDNNIEYSKTDIQITPQSQTENVSNQIDSCVDSKDTSNEEELACK